MVAAGVQHVALAAVSSWPGQRLVVLGPSAFASGVTDLVAIAAMSQGSIVLLADPFVDVNLVVARTGVAVGVNGIEELSNPKPSHFGSDHAVYAGLAVEAAAGAVATWPV